MPKHDALFTGHAAGHYTLPADLLELRQATTRLDSERPDPPQHPTDTAAELGHATVAAAAAGKPLPSVKPLAAAHAAYDLWRQQSDVLDAARNVAAMQLDSLVMDLAPTVIAEHLRPAMADLQRQVAEVAKVLPVDTSDRMLLLADDSTRRLWFEMDGHVTRYTSIRTAQQVVAPPLAGQQVDAGEFAVWDNLDDLWPAQQRSNNISPASPPWPEDPRAFLLWAATHGGRFAVLTIAEREARWHAKYDEQHAKRRAMADSAPR